MVGAGGRLCVVVTSLNCGIYSSVNMKRSLTFIKCLAFAEDYFMYFICIIILNSQNHLYGRYYRNTQFTYKKTKEKKAQNY